MKGEENMDTVKKIARAVLGLAMGACFALCGIPFVISHFIDGSLLVFEAMIFVMMVPAYLMYLLVILLHETGHMIAGLLSGYSFVSIRVLSFTVIRLEGRIRIRRFSLAGTGGQCLLKPPAWKEEGVPVRFYNLGGILLNLICFLLCLPFCFIVPVSTFGGMLLLSFTVFSGFTFFLNGVPVTNNDGDNVLHLADDKAAVRAFWAQMMGNALMAEGVALADIPEDLYDLPEGADLSNPLIAASIMNKSQIPLYHHRYEEADEAMARVQAEATGLPPVLKHLLANERLWYELMHENRTEVKEAFLTKEFQKSRKAMYSIPSFIRVSYTEALSKGDNAEAEKWTEKMDRLSKSYPFQNEIREERFLMEEARRHFSGIGV